MLRRIDEMPAGTVGFEAIGDVEDDDWEEVVEPVLKQWIAEGGRVRMLYVLGARSHEVEGEAMGADLGFRTRHASSFERVAVVTDEDWMRPALATLSFMLPGKAKAFRSAELKEAKDWLAAD